MPGCKKGDQAIVIRAVRDKTKLGCFVKVLEVGTQNIFGQTVRSCKIRFAEKKAWGIWDATARTYHVRAGIVWNHVGWFPDANLQPIRPPAIKKEVSNEQATSV